MTQKDLGKVVLDMPIFWKPSHTTFIDDIIKEIKMCEDLSARIDDYQIYRKWANMHNIFRIMKTCIPIEGVCPCKSYSQKISTIETLSYLTKEQLDKILVISDKVKNDTTKHNKMKKSKEAILSLWGNFISTYPIVDDLKEFMRVWRKNNLSHSPYYDYLELAQVENSVSPPPLPELQQLPQQPPQRRRSMRLQTIFKKINKK